ncbi:MAG: hypothetical protein OHK0019_31600 [Saprospiraceae bacterium]
MKSQENLRYPIGKFEYGRTWSLDETRRHIKAIAQLPKDLKKIIKKLKSGEMDLPYRKGGWTARQVIHHLADSHMNAYIRMKLAVTEQTPIIKPYEEAEWAKTEDSKSAPVKLSLRILSPLHKRWVTFLESLSEEDLERGYFHPEQKRVISLPEAIALYAWHGRHHLAHIRLVVEGKKQRQEEAEKPTARVARKPREQKDSNEKTSAIAPTPKRTRRSSAEVAAEKAAKAAAPKLSRAEILAKARAARAAKRAQESPATLKKTETPPKRTRRSSAEVAAEKAAKAAAPKLSRAEILAKARAARATKRAQESPAALKKTETPPKRTRRSSAEVAAEKAAKAAAPKLSRAEILAKARAARAAKQGQAAPKKVAKPEGPKLSRTEILAKARAARAAKRAQEAPAAPKAKPSGQKQKSAKPAGETKRKGLSPERMAEIRAMRGKKK